MLVPKKKARWNIDKCGNCLEQRQIRIQLVFIFSVNLGGVCVKHWGYWFILYIMLLEKGGKTRVLRVRIEHTVFLEASLHYRSTYKNGGNFLAAFCPFICQMPLSTRDDMKLVHGMFYSQTNFLFEKLYGIGMNVHLHVQHCWDVVLRIVSGLILDRLSESIAVVNTTKDLRTCMHYVNEECNLSSYVEQGDLALLWIVLSNCQFQGWPNDKAQNKPETFFWYFHNLYPQLWL